MKTIRFTYDARLGYRCSEPGDQDGEYVRLEDVQSRLVRAKEAERVLRAVVALPYVKERLSVLDRGIGTATPEGVWLAARSLVDQTTAAGIVPAIRAGQHASDEHPAAALTEEGR